MDSPATGKRLQLLPELIPELSNIALVLRTRGPENVRYIGEVPRAERQLGLQVKVLTVRDADDLARALVTERDVHALVVIDDAQFTAERKNCSDAACPCPAICAVDGASPALPLSSHLAPASLLYSSSRAAGRSAATSCIGAKRASPPSPLRKPAATREAGCGAVDCENHLDTHTGEAAKV
jgi:hypothetical protein